MYGTSQSKVGEREKRLLGMQLELGLLSVVYKTEKLRIRARYEDENFLKLIGQGIIKPEGLLVNDRQRIIQICARGPLVDGYCDYPVLHCAGCPAPHKFPNGDILNEGAIYDEERNTFINPEEKK